MNSTDVTDAQLPRGAGTADNEVRPSPAASILLLRGEPYEVLLMRRSDRSTFAPGAWVFPGGTLEEQDVSLARRFGEGENELLSMKVCAIREVFEETGILLADTNADASFRKELLSGSARFADLFDDPDTLLHDLVWTARWITPEGIPKRFDTWFFLATARENAEALPENRECVEAIWITPDEALRRERAGEMPLLFPTIRNLAAIAGQSSARELLESRRRAVVTTTRPVLIVEGQRKRIVLPEEV